MAFIVVKSLMGLNFVKNLTFSRIKNALQKGCALIRACALNTSNTVGYTASTHCSTHNSFGLACATFGQMTKEMEDKSVQMEFDKDIINNKVYHTVAGLIYD